MKCKDCKHCFMDEIIGVSSCGIGIKDDKELFDEDGCSLTSKQIDKVEEYENQILDTESFYEGDLEVIKEEMKRLRKNRGQYIRNLKKRMKKNEMQEL